MHAGFDMVGLHGPARQKAGKPELPAAKDDLRGDEKDQQPTRRGNERNTAQGADDHKRHQNEDRQDAGAPGRGDDLAQRDAAIVAKRHHIVDDGREGAGGIEGIGHEYDHS